MQDLVLESNIQSLITLTIQPNNQIDSPTTKRKRDAQRQISGFVKRKGKGSCKKKTSRAKSATGHGKLKHIPSFFTQS